MRSSLISSDYNLVLRKLTPLEEKMLVIWIWIVWTLGQVSFLIANQCIGILRSVSVSGHPWNLTRASLTVIPVRGYLAPRGHSLIQSIWHFNVQTNHLATLRTCRFWFSKSRWGLRFRISKKLPGETLADGAWAFE